MSKRFTIGFAVGLLIFILINVLSAHLASDCGLPALIGRDACADDIARAGWPLQFYEEGGFAYHRSLNQGPLLMDLGAGLAFGFLSGWLFLRNKTLSK